MSTSRRLLVYTLIALLAGTAVIAVLAVLGPSISPPPRACTLQYVSIQGRVFDAQTSEPITGAYWRSEAVSGLRREVIQEMPEGWTEGVEASDPFIYVVADDRLVTGRETQLTIRITVDKQGYQRIERELTVIVDPCHVRGVEGNTDFGLVPEGIN